MHRPRVIFAAVALLLGLLAPAAGASSSAMERLAADKGCYLCHTATPIPRKADDVLPHAPSWSDIAAKYKRQRDAEERLTRIVLRGSWEEPGARHWRGKVSDVGMPPNVPEIDAGQAKELVRWILSFSP